MKSISPESDEDVTSNADQRIIRFNSASYLNSELEKQIVLEINLLKQFDPDAELIKEFEVASLTDLKDLED